MRILLRFVSVVAVAATALALLVATVVRPMVAAATKGGSARLADVNVIDEPSERSYVYAADGSVIAVLHAEENRSPVTLEQVPPILVDAILDVEDERFWQHGPIDLRATLRALASNAESGGVVQGGSTITQQLVKNLLLTPERQVDRKVKEALLSVQMEKRFTKQQILEQYLNLVYFGNGAYGVQAAAETYFGEGVEKIDAVQAALLAGMISNPVGYDPVQNPDAAVRRRNLALDRMAQVGHVAAADADRLKLVPLPTSVRQPLPQVDDYFVEEVKRRLLDDPRLGETATERYNAVFRGGLRIYTTVDPRLQRAAEQRVAAGVPRNTQGFTAALVALEPATGKVRALVGGQGFDKSHFNLVTQAQRQPGSSFKLFTLLAMLEAGYGPNSTVDGTAPCKVKFPGITNVTPIDNSEGEAGGTMPMTKATALSVNCAFVRVAATIGLDKVAEMAHRLGITSHIDEVPSMVIGSEEVSPLEMAAAYATLPTDGVYHQPQFIDRVVDRDGKELIAESSVHKQVLDADTARIATQMLTGVVENGTGTRAALPGHDVAGKTGTTDDYTNAWFVGFTPELATAVWMGSPAGNVPMRNVGGVRVFGGTYPAFIWHNFMTDAFAGRPTAKFAEPDRGAIPKSTYIRGVPANGKSGKNGKNGSSTTTSSTPRRSSPTTAKPRSTTTTTAAATTTTGSTAPTTTAPRRP